MPNKTIYIKEEHLSIFNKVQEIGKDSISSIITDSLKRYIEEEEDRDKKLREGSDVEEKLFRILKHSSTLKASQIHLQPDVNEHRVRARIDGNLRDIDSVPENLYRPLVAFLKSLAYLDTDTQEPQGGRFSWKKNGLTWDLKISTLLSVLGETVTLNFLKTDTDIPKISQLDPCQRIHPYLQSIAQREAGLVFVTGPTSSGKSTTLYSLLKSVDRETKKVLTIENPVEAVIPGVIQVSSDEYFGKISQALRAGMKSSPDVILVGEIRDTETAQICMELAITGHLVFSVLHTNTAVGAFLRLRDIGIAPFFLKDAISTIIGQRLVRQLCPNCKESYSITKKEKEFLNDSGKTKKLYRPKGCSACGQTGYQGQIPLWEVLQPSSEFHQILEEGGDEQDLEKTLKLENRPWTWQEDGIEKAKEGYTSLDEVRRLVSWK